MLAKVIQGKRKIYFHFLSYIDIEISQAVSRRRMLIAISNQNVNHANQYPADNFSKYCSVGFVKGRYGWLLECHQVPSQKSKTVFVKRTILFRGYIGIDWIRSHQKKTTTKTKENIKSYAGLVTIKSSMYDKKNCLSSQAFFWEY